MTRPRKTIEASLLQKGFVPNETHHHQFFYHTLSGLKTGLRTRTSHGMRDVGQPILGQMGKQCGLTTGDFLDLVDCPLSREGYEVKVAALLPKQAPAPSQNGAQKHRTKARRK